MVRKQLNLGNSISNINLRVTYYSRVSTDDIKQKNSLRNQSGYFEEMIRNNENWTYIDGYVDDGITGTSDIKRDNFMKMIEDGKRDKFDLIITKEISRFSRNTLDSIKYTRELLENGVGVLFVNDNINTIMADSELRLTIMASMAQDEIRRLSERVKFGMNRAIVEGHILGNDRLFGYNKNKITGNLEIDVVNSKIVKDIYDMYVIEDLSMNKIVNYLNDNNIRTSFGNKFSVSTLSRMLRNPKYKGYYCGKKSEVIDYMSKKVKYFCMDEWVMYEDKMRIPPLVSEEMWNRAFEKLQKRSKKFGEGFKDNIMYQKRYPLSARVFCSNHNNVFYRRKLSKNSDEIVWYCRCCLDICNIRQLELYFIFNDIVSNYLEVNLENIMNSLFKLYELDNNDFSFNLDDGELKENMFNKLNDRLVELLLNKIEVSKFNDEDNIIDLKLFFNVSSSYFSNNAFSTCIFCEKDYEFKRGIDKKCAKRYSVFYKVKCFFI